MGSTERRLGVYLRPTFAKAVQSDRFDSWWLLHAISLNPFLPRPAAADRRFHLSVFVKHFFNNTVLLTHAPSRSVTFLLDVGIELTANQCQSVFASTARRVCRGRSEGPVR